MNLGQIALKGGTYSAKGECHFLHLVMDIACMLMTTLPMVLEGNILRILLDLVRTEIFKFANIEIIYFQILIIFLRVIKFADAIINNLCYL